MKLHDNKQFTNVEKLALSVIRNCINMARVNSKIEKPRLDTESSLDTDVPNDPEGGQKAEIRDSFKRSAQFYRDDLQDDLETLKGFLSSIGDRGPIDEADLPEEFFNRALILSEKDMRSEIKLALGEAVSYLALEGNREISHKEGEHRFYYPDARFLFKMNNIVDTLFQETETNKSKKEKPTHRYSFMSGPE